MTDFGNNFRRLRESAGLSQEDLAASLNISTSVVSRIENNKRKLDIDLICRLKEALHLDICQLAEGLFQGKTGSPGPELHFSKHYEKIIDEKNIIIEEKNRYILQLETRQF